MQMIQRNGSQPERERGSHGAPRAMSAAPAWVIVLLCVLWSGVPSAAQTWDASTKSTSAGTKAIFLTYSQTTGFYPATVSRSAGSFVIHVAVRDRQSTPIFQISSSAGAAVSQATVKLGKPGAVQVVNLDPGVYRLTVAGSAASVCTITITK